MELNNIIAFIACIIFILIISKFFIVPIKIIFKLILNSVIGGILIFLINIMGGFFGLHIGLNLITSIFVGILGIPGAVVVILIKILLG